MEPCKKDHLKEEYLKLQDQYEDYDRRALQIKGWIGAGAITGMAIGFDPNKSGSGTIWILIAIIAGCFWYLEARWKVFQYALADRIRIIEGVFREDNDLIDKNIVPFQIYSSWYESYSNDAPIYPYESKNRPKTIKCRIMKVAIQDYVMLPYSLIIAICLFLAMCGY